MNLGLSIESRLGLRPRNESFDHTEPSQISLALMLCRQNRADECGDVRTDAFLLQTRCHEVATSSTADSAVACLARH